jgi:hypothetical protein
MSGDGLPVDVVTAAILDHDRRFSSAFREWQEEVAAAERRTRWEETPIEQRQVLPSVTPPEVFATLQPLRLGVTVPSAWVFEPEGDVVDMSQVRSLCARTSVGYGSCLPLHRSVGPTMQLDAYVRSPGDPVEIVIRHDDSVTDQIVAVGSVEGAAFVDGHATVRIEGEEEAAQIVVE